MARCGWAEGSEAMRRYHDEEWGVPRRDDPYLFELLTLETMQAGLSWSTVLAKRENYRRALDGFDPERVAAYDDDRLDALLRDPGIVRHRLKVRALRTNAAAFRRVRDEHGTFGAYLWGFVAGEPVVTRRAAGEPPPARTELSDRVAWDLKRRGFAFVGSTTAYAYLQAVGVVDDHAAGCPAARA